MAIAPLIVAIRTAGAAALAGAATRLRAFGSTVSSVSRRLFAQQRQVSSVAGAYRDANGLWRNANGTLLTQRHTVTTVTTAFGRLVNALRRVSHAAAVAAAIIGGPLRRALRSAADAARNLIRALAMFAIKGLLIGSALIPVVVALGKLLPLAMLLAPAALAAGAALVTLKFGMDGVGDALKAGLSGDVEEFNKALKKLAPSAQEFVKATVALAPAWRQLKQSIQQKLFAGLGAEITALSKTALPFLDRWLGRLATKFNTFAKEVMAGLRSPETMQQLDVIFAGIDSFVAGALRSIKALGRAFLDIAEAASPAFAELGADIGNAAERFAEWIRELKDDGTLARWIESAKETFGQLKDIGKELGRVFSAIFKGTDSQGFLEALKNSIQDLADWLHSDSGQSVIRFFSDVGKAIASVISWIVAVVDWFKKGWDSFRESTEGLRNSLTTAFAAIGTAAGAMFGIIGTGVAAFGWIGGVLSRLGGLVAGIRNAVSAINAALGAIRTTVFIDIITRRSEGYIKPIGGGGGGGGSARFRASGGPVMKGQPYIVGEKRPELFVPNQSGRILPNVPMGGGSVARQVIEIRSGGTAFDDALLEVLSRAIRRNGGLEVVFG